MHSWKAFCPFFIVLTLKSHGQASDRVIPRGIYLRNNFVSGVQDNTFGNVRSTEIDVAIGLFCLIPVRNSLKDTSVHLLVLKQRYRPKPWSIRHLRFDVGFTPKAGTFFLSQTQSFNLIAKGLDLTLSAPLYYKPSDRTNIYFASGFNGCYYFSTQINNPLVAPDVKIDNYSIGLVLEIGFLVGEIENPVLFIGHRFQEQVTGTYRFREFSITMCIPILKKFGRIR